MARLKYHAISGKKSVSASAGLNKSFENMARLKYHAIRGINK
jgi:hypothetical protein